MIVDEELLSDALHAVEVDVAPDLPSRARRGGQRRLLRRRSAAAAGVTAVAAVGVPVGLVVRSGGGHIGISPASGGGPANQLVSDLYASPPAAGAQCNGGFTAREKAAMYPQLLLLPADQPLKYAFVRQNRANCADPHVALTAYRTDGASLTAGLVIEGPDAPTPTEGGMAGPDVSFSGDTGHVEVDGQDGTEFSLPGSSTTVYWTEPDGGQWSASVRGLSAAGAVSLLNTVSYDGTLGTASLPSTAGWTVAPIAHDVPKDTGWVVEQWNDSSGQEIDLSLYQTPTRTYQEAAKAAGRATFVTVRGHQGVLSQDIKGGAGLTWQEGPDVEAQLTAPANEIQQIAASLALTTPEDPRINTN
jgi:hypothetical protein